MTAVHNWNLADRSPLDRRPRMQETIAELLLEAMTFCVNSKVEETVRKWLSHADIAPDDPRAGDSRCGGDDLCSRTLHFHAVHERRPVSGAILA